MQLSTNPVLLTVIDFLRQFAMEISLGAKEFRREAMSHERCEPNDRQETQGQTQWH
jgi:hypothetical protein